MQTVVDTKKGFFLLIRLQLHLIDRIRRQTYVGRKFLHSFIELFERFFNF